MRLMRKTILFLTGGCGYVGVEYLWRGWSHGSMFLAGGSCFLLLGAASKRLRHRSPVVRAIAGSTIITAVELTQLFTLLGSCDIDDLILNVVGAAVGYGLFKCLTKKPAQ